MKRHLMLLSAAAFALAGCWTEGDDKSAELVEEHAENAAAQLDAEADNATGRAEEELEDTAEVVRDGGEAAAESVDDNDLVLNEAKKQ